MEQQILAISAPSGTGKGCVIRAVLEKDPSYHLAISCTTRAKREGEIDGMHYNFLSGWSFTRKIVNNEFAEWAEVHGQYYGTPKTELDYKNVILEIDTLGVEQIKQQYENTHRLFLLPSSRVELENRLRARGTESEEEIKIRLSNATREIARAHLYDFWIENDDVERAAGKIINLGAYLSNGGRFAVIPAFRDEKLLERVRSTFQVTTFA